VTRPMITHLLFTDDSSILMEANENNALILRKILDLSCDMNKYGHDSLEKLNTK
jgi:hypothetical protein